MAGPKNFNGRDICQENTTMERREKYCNVVAWIKYLRPTGNYTMTLRFSTKNVHQFCLTLRLNSNYFLNQH
jgi:hypothetical protein